MGAEARTMASKKSILSMISILLVLGPVLLWTSEKALPEVQGVENRVLEVGSGKTYLTVDDAIMAARNGDLVLVHPGVYDEHLIIDKGIILEGTDRNRTVIDGFGVDSTIKVMADHVTVRNLTIMGSGWNTTNGSSGLTAYNAGIWVGSDHLTVKDCTFRKNPKVSIFFDDNGDHTMVKGCEFQGSTMNHLRFGNSVSEYISILGNRFLNDAYQVVFYGPDSISDLLIAGNELIDTDPEHRPFASISFSFDHETLHRGTIAANRIFGTQEGIVVKGCRDLNITHNTFINCSSNALRVNLSKDVRIHHNNFIGCNRGSVQCNNFWKRVDWNDSYMAGNYWSDYSRRYPNASNEGGVWSEPYVINVENGAADLYPLVNTVTDAWKGSFGPILLGPTPSLSARRNDSLQFALELCDPDTPTDELEVRVTSGYDWLVPGSGHIFSGTVPDYEPTGDHQVNISVTDGTNILIVKVLIEVLPEPALIGHLTFSEIRYGCIEDVSGHGNTGRVWGDLILVRGIIGNGAYFDGRGDCIDLGPLPDLVPGGGYSISLFIYPIGSYENTLHIVQKGTGSSGDLWTMSLKGGGSGKLQVRSDGPGNFHTVLESNREIAHETWTHIVFTYTGSVACLYMDGVLEYERTAYLPFPDERYRMVLGDNSTLDCGFMGIMDEVMVHDHPLNGSEALAYFNRSKDAIPSYTLPGELAGKIDRDRDSLPDRWEMDNFDDLDQYGYDDPDKDGSTNLNEFLAGTDPNYNEWRDLYYDTDWDGLPDEWEYGHFGDLSQRANSDMDGDGYTELDEFEMESDPTDPDDPEVQRRRPPEVPIWWVLLIFDLSIFTIVGLGVLVHFLIKRGKRDYQGPN